MSWLTNVVRPKLRELVGSSRQVPDNLWDKCPACEQMIFHRELEKNLKERLFVSGRSGPGCSRS